MKLYYFNFPARAEVTRMMLRAGKVTFEDVRFERPEWHDKYQAKSPTGLCPYLELDNGELLAETSAIETYVSRITGFLPSDNLTQAKAIMMCSFLAEMWQTLFPSFRITDLDERIAERKKLMAEGGETAKKWDVVEKLLAQRSTKFAVSDEPSVADLNIFSTVSNFRSGFMDGFSEASFERHPVVMELWRKVAALPEIAEQYKDSKGIKAYEGYKI